MNSQNEIVTFKKTNELFGGFSNMSGDYPILVNGNRIRTVEHLYQSLKFTDHPEIQQDILDKSSPTISKLVSRKKENREKIRDDWETIKLEVMEYCLRAKLIYHWVKFGDLLRKTDNKDIYGVSTRKDQFWGVFQQETGFRGENKLGQLLMNLRDGFVNQDNETLRILVSPPLLNLRLLGSEIQTIDRRRHLCQVGTRTSFVVDHLR